MATKTYTKYVLVGGGTGALDAIDGDELADNYRAVVITEVRIYTYLLDATSGATTNGYSVIAPVTNPGNKRWILKSTDDSINPIDYGADNTGGADVTAAFTAAALALKSVEEFGHAMVVTGGNYLFSTTWDIDDQDLPIIFKGNPLITIDNNVAAIRAGNTTSSGLDMTGHARVTQDAGSTGVGVLFRKGSLNIDGLRGFDTDTWIVECHGASARDINNSYIGNFKVSNCGGIYLHNDTRSSLEIELDNIHSSQSTTECLKADSITDLQIGTINGDTKTGSSHDAIIIDNCGAVQGANILVNSKGGTGVFLTGNSDSITDTTSRCHFGVISTTGSKNGMIMNCKSVTIDSLILGTSQDESLIMNTWCEGNKIDKITSFNGSTVIGSSDLLLNTTGKNSIGSISVTSGDADAVIEIGSGSNNLKLDILLQATASGTGSNVIWANNNRPMYLGSSFTTDYIYTNEGSVTVTGTGTGAFNIPHGLTGTPAIYTVMSVDNKIAFQVTANATNLQVGFASSVTNPSFVWTAKIF